MATSAVIPISIDISSAEESAVQPGSFLRKETLQVFESL